LAALQTADPIFLVTNMDVPSLRNLKRCLPILDRVTAGDSTRLRLVVNRFNPKSLVRVQDLEDTLGLDVYWTLTNDYQTVIQSISTGQPLVMQGRSRYADQLKGLARSIADGQAGPGEPKRSLLGRLFSPRRASKPGRRARVSSKPAEAANHG
jgi:pilus assembly protein CpaE